MNLGFMVEHIFSAKILWRTTDHTATDFMDFLRYHEMPDVRPVHERYVTMPIAWNGHPERGLESPTIPGRREVFSDEDAVRRFIKEKGVAKILKVIQEEINRAGLEMRDYNQNSMAYHIFCAEKAARFLEKEKK